MKKLIIVAILALAIALPLESYAKGGGGGGRSGGGARSSSTSSRSTSTTSVRTSTGTTVTPSKPSAPRISTRPSTTTTKVTTATGKTVNGKTFSKTGSVVDATYQPKFTGGYSAPLGSTVYYQNNSLLSWLPFYMIMTSQSHRQAVVVEPAKDGQPAVEKIVKEEGIDTMYIINWVVSILLVLGVIGGIVWYVNRRTI